MDEINKNFAAQLLLEDPETGEELRPIYEPIPNDDGGFCVYVMSEDGSRKWKHTIKTEEV